MAPIPLSILMLLPRGSVNPGVIAGTAVATEEGAKKAPTTKRGAIIGIVVGATLLIIMGLIAYCVRRHKKRKLGERGTKIVDVGGNYEEIRPLGHGPTEEYTGAQREGMGITPVYQPPQAYPVAGYAQGPPQGHPMLGQQGTEYYRSQ